MAFKNLAHGFDQWDPEWIGGLKNVCVSKELNIT